MAGVLQSAYTRSEMDASARSLDVVGLAAWKEGRTALPSPPRPFGPGQPRIHGFKRGPRRVPRSPPPAYDLLTAPRPHRWGRDGRPDTGAACPVPRHRIALPRK